MLLALLALLSILIAARSLLDARAFQQAREQGKARLPAPPAAPQLATQAGAVNPKLARSRDRRDADRKGQLQPDPQRQRTREGPP